MHSLSTASSFSYNHPVWGKNVLQVSVCASLSVLCLCMSVCVCVCVYRSSVVCMVQCWFIRILWCSVHSPQIHTDKCTLHIKLLLFDHLTRGCYRCVLVSKDFKEELRWTIFSLIWTKFENWRVVCVCSCSSFWTVIPIAFCFGKISRLLKLFRL